LGAEQEQRRAEDVLLQQKGSGQVAGEADHLKSILDGSFSIELLAIQL
jgi:hypothetical protein